METAMHKRAGSAGKDDDDQMTSAGAAPPGEIAADRLASETNATYAVFASLGFAVASWAARIPQVKHRFDLDPFSLGLVLLAPAVGAVIGLPLSGPLVTRLGARRMIAGSATLAGVGLVIVAIGYRLGVAPVAVGLFMFGVASGNWDVAVNVEGAIVERRARRALMARFHAAFSIGTVAGAVLGTALVALRISVTADLAAVGSAIGVGVPLAVRRLPADRPAHVAPSQPKPARASLRAWRERRTLLIGVFVLAFAFAEGIGNDWISVAVVDGHHTAPAIGTLVFAAFLAAMTLGRWFGPALLHRYGRVRLVRGLTGVAIAGIALFAFGPSTSSAFAGAVLWGLGASLGFPVGMSAGADDPALAAVRVSVISSIGYLATLGGPPLIGFLGQQFTVLHAVTASIILLVPAAAIAGVLAPLRPLPT
jgi:fucose permease